MTTSRGPTTSTELLMWPSTYSLTLPSRCPATGPFAELPMTSRASGLDAMWATIAAPLSSPWRTWQEKCSSPYPLARRSSS